MDEWKNKFYLRYQITTQSTHSLTVPHISVNMQKPEMKTPFNDILWSAVLPNGLPWDFGGYLYWTAVLTCPEISALAQSTRQWLGSGSAVGQRRRRGPTADPEPSHVTPGALGSPRFPSHHNLICRCQLVPADLLKGNRRHQSKLERLSNSHRGSLVRFWWMILLVFDAARQDAACLLGEGRLQEVGLTCQPLYTMYMMEDD